MANEMKNEVVGAAAAQEGTLLEQLLAESRIKPSDEGYEVARRGVAAFIAEMLAPNKVAEKVDRSAVDGMIAEVDKKLSAQVNEIMHHPDVQKLESAWRSLRFSIERIDFRENIKVDLLSVDRDTIQADLEDAPDLTKSGLYRLVYSNEYGVFGGKPYGVMNVNFEFGPGPVDVEFLRRVSSIAAMSHVPVIANASPSFFGEKSFQSLPTLKDLKSIFEGPQYARWVGFRESEDARYLGLCLPRFLLRVPYGEKSVPVKAFNFEEDVVGQHDRYLWGYASNALVTRIAESFARYRWSPNIIGPQAGGTVENLPLHTFESMGELQNKVPTEILITERREYELSEEGFISLVYRKDADNACFFSANSAQKAKTFGNTAEGKAAETNYRLGTQLPYMFIMTRLAHYIKVLQREQIGSWKERTTLERELNRWIGQYVADMEDPAPSVRSQRPLRQAKVSVEDVEGQPGWYRCSLKVRPHFKYMGASFTLSLVGKLDKD
jgi:type VI secretion system protein ImpC